MTCHFCGGQGTDPPYLRALGRARHSVRAGWASERSWTIGSDRMTCHVRGGQRTGPPYLCAGRARHSSPQGGQRLYSSDFARRSCMRVQFDDQFPITRHTTFAAGRGLARPTFLRIYASQGRMARGGARLIPDKARLTRPKNRLHGSKVRLTHSPASAYIDPSLVVRPQSSSETVQGRGCHRSNPR
jgi:hypothetical protein